VLAQPVLFIHPTVALFSLCCRPTIYFCRIGSGRFVVSQSVDVRCPDLLEREALLLILHHNNSNLVLVKPNPFLYSQKSYLNLVLSFNELPSDIIRSCFMIAVAAKTGVLHVN
jgi:hypothetical protein